MTDKKTLVPAEIMGLPIVSRLAPEYGTGWLVKLPHTSKRLDPLRLSYNIIPSGMKHTIIQKP